MLVLIILVCLFLLIALTGFLLAVYIHCRLFNRRYEGNQNLKYFTANDFDNLVAEPVEFLSAQNVTLRGAIYYKKGKRPDALIIFAHGFGGGHLAYTTEVNFFAENGFYVLAYDGTGCGKSEGRYFRGFDQGPLDVRAAIEFSKNHPKIKKLPRILIGHSWGGFSVINAIENDVQVDGIVSICGFLSGADIMAQTVASRFCPIYYWLKPFFSMLNLLRFGTNANFNSKSLILKLDLPICLMYGKEDQTVKYSKNGAKMECWARKKENMKFYAWEKKGHNVYLSEQAEKYMNNAFSEIEKQKKQKKNVQKLYSALDYKLMTQEDEKVMKIILDFCKTFVHEKDQKITE